MSQIHPSMSLDKLPVTSTLLQVPMRAKGHRATFVGWPILFLPIKPKLMS